MRARRAIILVLLLPLARLACEGVAVGASCAAPALVPPSSPLVLQRGEFTLVVGEGFGDACHDTGVPPGAPGPLGHPLTDIEIVFEQSGHRTVVARGAADRAYMLVTRVVVPRALEPGTAVLGVGYAEGAWGFEVEISDRPPLPGPDDVQQFGPRAAAASSDDDLWRGAVIGGGAVALVGGILLLLRRGRSVAS